MNKYNNSPFVVNRVTFEFTRVVDDNNDYHEKMRVEDAIRQAKGARLELVCFNKPSRDTLALCKIIDYGKWKYEAGKKKKKEEKEHKKSTKEIRFSPGIGDNDIHHKIKNVHKYLEEGDVLFSMRMKGRELAHYEIAEEKLNEIIGSCDGVKELSRKKSRNMITVRLTKT